MSDAFNVEHIDDAWIKLLQNRLKYQTTEESRYGKCKEVNAVSVSIHDIGPSLLCNPLRKLDPAYAFAELCWYLSGEKHIKRIEAYAPQYRRMTGGDLAYGAYGPRMVQKFKWIIEALKAKPNTRQAVISIFNSLDTRRCVGEKQLDIPCTLSLQFLIRNRRLHMITTMRSNDIWLGFPYDVFCFTSIQKIIAAELEIATGIYTHQVGSMHVYEKHFKAFDAVSCDSYFFTGDRVKDTLAMSKSFVVAEETIRNGALDIDARSLRNSTIFNEGVYAFRNKWFGCYQVFTPAVEHLVKQRGSNANH